jgi:WD40 repeat protein
MTLLKKSKLNIENIPGVKVVGFIDATGKSIIDPSGQKILICKDDGMLKPGSITVYSSDLTEYTDIPAKLYRNLEMLINDIAADVSGRYAVIAGKNKSYSQQAHVVIRLVDIERKISEPYLAGHTNSAANTGKGAFNPDASLVVLSSLLFGQMYVVDVQSVFSLPNTVKNVLYQMQNDKNTQVLALSWSPDGNSIVQYSSSIISNVRVLSIWKVTNGSALEFSADFISSIIVNAKGTAPISASTEIAFSSNSDLLAVGGDKRSQTIKLFDARHPKLLFESESLGCSSHTLAFTKDSKYLASGSKEGFVHIWEVVDSELKLKTIKQLPGEIYSVRYDGGRNKIIASYKENNRKIGICQIE